MSSVKHNYVFCKHNYMSSVKHNYMSSVKHNYMSFVNTIICRQ